MGVRSEDTSDGIASPRCTPPIPTVGKYFDPCNRAKQHRGRYSGASGKVFWRMPGADHAFQLMQFMRTVISQIPSGCHLSFPT
jgi:hypothetical protein